MTSRSCQARLQILVLASFLGCQTILSAATNSVQSKSYQEALKVFRATPAYQQAALELLTREANWIAERVGINEPISGDPAEIGPPGYGFSGSVGGSNYTFSFSNGRFHDVRWNDWTRKIDPPLNDLLEFSRRPSQLDVNSALELAQTWLKNLGIDLDSLSAKSTPSVFQVPANSARETPPGQPRPMRPQFIITWPGPPKIKLSGGRPLPPNMPPMRGGALVTVEILGAAKQLIELTVSAPELWRRPPLELKDANTLLGPDPSPAELMAKILTPRTYETIANPDAIEAWLLTSNRSGQPKKDRSGPVKLDPALAKKFSAALLDFNSYNSWDALKGCVTDDGVRLRIRRGAKEVQIRFCFECDILTVTRADSERALNFDQGHNRFADLVQETFPNDPAIRALPRKPGF